MRTKLSIEKTNEPIWLCDFREKNSTLFHHQEWPNKKNEYWKYTNVSFLKNEETVASMLPVDELKKQIDAHRIKDAIFVVLVDGKLDLSYSNLDNEQLIICPFNKAWSSHEALIKKYWDMPLDPEKYPFALLNAALFHDGLFVFVPDHVVIERPLHVLSIATKKPVYERQFLFLGKNSQLTLLEEFITVNDIPTLLNRVSTSVMAEGACLEQVKIQKGNSNALHLHYGSVHQKQNTTFSFFNFSLGGAFSRDDWVIHLEEKNASTFARGFYHANADQQYVDHHLEMKHLASFTKSKMQYKGILKQKSCGVFHGGVKVFAGVQKISSSQMNHNLLLSSEAEVYSKPELEIHADDVQCQHGATVGEIDEEMLFYLRTRGLSLLEAKKILLQGFVQDIIQSIRHPSLITKAKERICCVC